MFTIRVNLKTNKVLYIELLEDLNKTFTEASKVLYKLIILKVLLNQN